MTVIKKYCFNNSTLLEKKIVFIIFDFSNFLFHFFFFFYFLKLKIFIEQGLCHQQHDPFFLLLLLLRYQLERCKWMADLEHQHL